MNIQAFRVEDIVVKCNAKTDGDESNMSLSASVVSYKSNALQVGDPRGGGGAFVGLRERERESLEKNMKMEKRREEETKITISP